MDERSRWFKLITVASQTLNVLLFNGSPNETVSGRAHRQGRIEADPKWAKAADWINWLFRDPHHCLKSHLLDLQFARAIVALHP